ncbi:MAG: bifunctional nuclease family protein [Bacteroidetes bacterium]|nr:MAG: bifunctional nuclease family protein [Bacteroidota bacterium]
MNKIKLEILGLSSSQSQTGSFALVMGEEGRNRRLPIIIGMFEAQAIAIEMEKIVSNRPMTHDLFKSFAESFNFDLHEILISDLKEGVFYAKIVCSSNTTYERFEIDSRPSDAVAIGLRFNVPIYTYESILSEAGIVLNELEESSESSSEQEMEEEQAPKSLKEYESEELELMLEEALNNEDYEKAARIRDELQKR